MLFPTFFLVSTKLLLRLLSKLNIINAARLPVCFWWYRSTALTRDSGHCKEIHVHPRNLIVLDLCSYWGIFVCPFLAVLDGHLPCQLGVIWEIYIASYSARLVCGMKKKKCPSTDDTVHQPSFSLLPENIEEIKISPGENLCFPA